MVLPEGSSIPPLPHLLVIVAGVALVGWLLWRERPAITQDVVVALVPWMLLGAALHVLYQFGVVPPSVAPLLGTPAVYLTSAVLAGAGWLLVRRAAWPLVPTLGGAGLLAFLVAAAVTLWLGGVARIALPAAALAVGAFAGGATWLAFRHVRPVDAATTGRVGLLVLLGHAIDGVSTAVGVDLLGFGERTPGSRFVMDVAGALPTADLIGVGWLFVLVKLLVAAVVVALFAEYVRDDPSPANALLGLIAAVGLGPGVHNLLLYTAAVP